ncbi:hypothetical protein PS691_00043 [Pseudomonas fluorescens]|uniref:Oligosaccharide repeat unit polymerase n=2 Tax=Pseudomonas fluorescens TaxID=294 RepID=A0A5E6ZJQ6_PSEFL|nr:hypothetical protein PS691_00043 [Pseudomonas fluorescens]
MFFPWGFAIAANKLKLKESPTLYSGKLFSLTFYCMQTSVVACILANLSIQGFSPADFFSDLLGTANKYLVARYDGKITPNIYAQLGVALNYTGVCIGGMIVGNRKNIFRKLIVFAMSFIPSALHMLIYADKGTLFLCAALFYGGVIIARTHAGDTDLTNKKTNRIALVSVLVLFPILLASFMARGIGDGTTSQTIERLQYYMSSYAFGHLYAFSDWFSSITSGESRSIFYNSSGYTYGLYTFMAIFKFFGDTTYIPDGYYEEYYNFNDLIQTNIYTMYRGLIQDFSFVGALVYMACSGILFNLAYYRLLTSKKPVFSAALYICMIGYIYSTFLISIMTWNSIFAVFVVLSLIFMANCIFNELGKRSSIAT